MSDTEVIEVVEVQSADPVKKRKKKKKPSLTQKFQRWLEETASQVEGVENPLLLPREFVGYSFQGDLRPAFVTPQMKVEPSIRVPDYHETGIPTSEMAARAQETIHIHTDEEIEKMRVACRLGREVIDIAGKFLKVGVTGDEIDRVVYKASMERGCYPSPHNYRNFPKSVCVSVNEVICHGIPDCRPIQDGDVVNLDVTVYKDGFHADLNETFLVGNCDEDSVRLVKTAYECLQKSCDMIGPGCLYRDLGASISKIAAQNDCTVVKTYCGHGIGELFHTSPNVPHYAKNKAKGIMRPGHIFTVEPMINLGSNWKDDLWPDNWTAVTHDGKRSAQFEHTFLVTEDGVEILTARKGTNASSMSWDAAAVTRN